MFIYLVLNRVDYMIGSETTTGNVIRIKKWYSRGSYSAPVINFKTELYNVTFQGETNMDVEVGDKVKVIYKTEYPSDAEVFSFVGFWLAPLLYCLVPLMVLAAAVFTFLEKNTSYNIYVGRGMKFSKSKIVEKYSLTNQPIINELPVDRIPKQNKTKTYRRR